MAKRLVPRTRAFYQKYLPIGDRLGEMFYAVWMVVVSLGILGGTGFEGGAIAYVIFIAFGVNAAWGVIDGVTVMHTNIIETARGERTIYQLQTKNDAEARKAGAEMLDDGITSNLSPADREKVLDIIASTTPLEDPTKKHYRPTREDWYYALGIFAIDFLMVFPLVAPLVLFPNPHQAVYISRLLATVIFAIIGAAYARNLNRRRWLAALFLGTLCFSLFTLVFLAGW